MTSLTDKVFLVTKSKEYLEWFKLVNTNEFKLVREYINARVTDYKNQQNEANKQFNLDSAMKLQVAHAVEAELQSLLKHFDYMASQANKTKGE